ncbi:probable O-methyltransferase 3 [Vigna umbellata]|uniref:probable O-methyltransferase 3 n=1 Tax=Vigna umbellata TaxID=87088 RepID=UPI001F5E4192|nr:probable O-methyltransferase 3 [Vigna umbellata]
MSFDNEDHSSKLLEAQTHIFNQTFGFINSMSLKCAIDLCIPDVIHNYGQSMPLSKLIASLPIHPSKTCFVSRLMQILVHSGFFSQHSDDSKQEVSYALTDASALLLKEHPFSMTCLPQVILDPILVNPWFQFSTWFTNDVPTPFHAQNGMTFWDYAGREPKLNHLFNDAMTNDTRLISSVMIEKCKGVLEGMESLVDVGGGTGTMAKAIAKSFPHLKCTVFDLPHVVHGLQGTDNIEYVGGDMFQAIPSADSIMLKTIMHNWNDEECLKILKRCKEAIEKKDKGKVIIIDVVIGNLKGDSVLDQTKLYYDMEMMVLVTGKERNEKDWAKLFFSAGFNHYKITPVLGFKSLIEVYP